MRAQLSCPAGTRAVSVLRRERGGYTRRPARGVVGGSGAPALAQTHSLVRRRPFGTALVTVTALRQRGYGLQLGRDDPCPRVHAWAKMAHPSPITLGLSNRCSHLRDWDLTPPHAILVECAHGDDGSSAIRTATTRAVLLPCALDNRVRDTIMVEDVQPNLTPSLSTVSRQMEHVRSSPSPIIPRAQGRFNDITAT